MRTFWSRWRRFFPALARRSSEARRFADVYGAALERLSDSAAPTRVGALRTLELLAEANPAHRQAVVDVLCAYLRTTSVAEGDGPVRELVQQILGSHLKPTAAGGGFWEGISLDLTAATLVDFDLSGCRVDGGIRADLAVFHGATKLRGTVIGAPATWHGATFHDHVWMERAVFVNQCHFDAVVFHADAWFGEATFANVVSFEAATFGGHAWFGRCEFRGPVTFSDAAFHRSAGFRGASVHVPPGLSGTTFQGPARVSRRKDGWNFTAPGWTVVVDPDNESVGQLVRVTTGGTYGSARDIRDDSGSLSDSGSLTGG